MTAPTYGDRVQETFATTGTGTISLSGAVTGYQAFSSALADGATCYYGATDGTNWEVGLGTFTAAGDTLARTTIIASSSGGAAVNWAAGTKSIWLDLPASVISSFITSVPSSVVSVHAQLFTGSGTYTPTTGMLFCLAFMQAGGASGAAQSSTGNTTGGGAGSAAIVLLTAAQVGASKTVTIGAGGTAVTGGAANNGNTGGTTSLGSLVSCPGGTAGQPALVGLGPTAAPTISTGIGIAKPGGAPPASISTAGGGPGADSLFGAGGNGLSTSGTGNAGSLYGGGGSGGVGNVATHSGAGAAGAILIVEFCSQ